MVLNLLYISLFICFCGVIYQWVCFRRPGKLFKKQYKPNFYPRLIDLLSGFLNTVFQIRLLKAGKIRWLAHFFVFSGFLYLIFVHGLHQLTSGILFDYYDPTVDPFQFLRNFFGTLVVTGCIVFFLRRYINIRINRDRQVKYKGYFSIILIFCVVGTGFLLEASKIISEPVFMDMVETYSDLDDGDELDDLKLFWQENYGVYFDTSLDPEGHDFDNGQFLDEEYCISCHSDIRSSFVSHRLAGLVFSYGKILNQMRADKILYGIHYGVCLVLIAFFPFLRLNHIVLIPLSSVVKKQDKQVHLKDRAQIFSAALFACTNCGYCSQVCSVYPNFQIGQNPDLLPHSKIESIKRVAAKDPDVSLWGLQKGNDACTLCNKCTQICPSNIDLQTLWSVTGRLFSDENLVDNQGFFNRIRQEEWTQSESEPGMLISTGEISSDLIEKIDAFDDCIQCTICTNICPVVEYDSMYNDYTPQQVMNLLRLGQNHLASGTRMVWTCLTCYACQEICPQKIPVTDIILELRQIGGRKADAIKLKDMVKKKVGDV